MTTRFAILGNAGSGKSTLAGWLAGAAGLAMLGLDTVAWEPAQPAVARPPAAARADVAAFCARHERWVIEGCYADLVEAALPYRPRLVLLDPGLEACLANCRRRPWEPHKYPSKQAQDANLQPLLSWAAGYYVRGGTMSLKGHRQCLAGFAGRKVVLRRLPRLHPPEAQLLAWLDRGPVHQVRRA